MIVITKTASSSSSRRRLRYRMIRVELNCVPRKKLAGKHSEPRPPRGSRGSEAKERCDGRLRLLCDRCVDVSLEGERDSWHEEEGNGAGRD